MALLVDLTWPVAPLLTEIMLQLVSQLSAAVAFLQTGPILKIVVSISHFNGKIWGKLGSRMKKYQIYPLITTEEQTEWNQSFMAVIFLYANIFKSLSYMNNISQTESFALI